ncbi:MAG TPA: hypothetical protein VMB85_08735 [Bryobacteraceae bacterium]|nr:hypothetical protein [Bryobacteraceae bacterium]
MAILAVGAIIMAVRPEHFTKIERIGWVVIACGLFFVEIRSINNERDQHDKEQSAVRKEEELAFKSIADGITTSIEKNQQAFDATMRRMQGLTKLSKESIDQVTGGRSYPIAVATTNPNDGLAGFPVTIFNSGPYTLYGLSASIQEVRGVFDMSIPQHNFGDLRPYDLVDFPNFRVQLPESDKKDREYALVFRARNGGWNEYLHIRRNGTSIRNAEELYSLQFPGKPGKLIAKTTF